MSEEDVKCRSCGMILRREWRDNGYIIVRYCIRCGYPVSPILTTQIENKLPLGGKS